MAPRGKEMQEKFKNIQLVCRHKDGKDYRRVGGQLKINQTTIAAVMTNYGIWHILLK